ncbi:MAG: hypothetical protein BJ554DRAFT_181 [Olpidium bornovanus]|uniref:Uncharacterized protein n=1 Tax=Olpidium bornovanus TaxID=278681 RepID=A0A8H7ZU84_9FUNG|nr:MAG: hypothetical protein BJ554DRAFT_181 [Olpidium bornovanus]
MGGKGEGRATKDKTRAIAPFLLPPPPPPPPPLPASLVQTPAAPRAPANGTTAALAGFCAMSSPGSFFLRGSGTPSGRSSNESGPARARRSFLTGAARAPPLSFPPPPFSFLPGPASSPAAAAAASPRFFHGVPLSVASSPAYSTRRSRPFKYGFGCRASAAAEWSAVSKSRYAKLRA